MAMKKVIMTACLALTALLARPTGAAAFSYYLPEAPSAFVGSGEPADERDADMQQPQIQILNGQNAVTVTGAQGQQMEIVSLTGRRVATVRIDSPAQQVELNLPKGCYILKIGKTARKVSVK